MSSLSQKRVLLGLQAGLKLREVLQEPHMPSMRMLDEWLGNPEFNAAYLAAMDTGQNYRAKQMANRPVAPAPKLATEMDKPEPELKVVLPPTVDITYMNPSQISLVPTASEIARLEPIVDDAFYAATLPLAIDDDTLKHHLMQRLRDGEFSSKMVDNTPGFYADKLTKWLREPDFVVEWNKAKAVGRDKRWTGKRVDDALAAEPTVVLLPPTPLVSELPIPAPEPIAEPTLQPGSPQPVPNPALEFLPEGMVRRFVVLKAEESYDCLMSLDDAQRFAQADCAQHGTPFYIAQIVAVAAPLTTAVLHPIA